MLTLYSQLNQLILNFSNLNNVAHKLVTLVENMLELHKKKQEARMERDSIRESDHFSLYPR